MWGICGKVGIWILQGEIHDVSQGKIVEKQWRKATGPLTWQPAANYDFSVHCGMAMHFFVSDKQRNAWRVYGTHIAQYLRNLWYGYRMHSRCISWIQAADTGYAGSNLTPRLWDMLYRDNGVIIPDVHQVIDNGKGQWDWEMLSRVDNAILVPFLHTGEVQPVHHMEASDVSMAMQIARKHCEIWFVRPIIICTRSKTGSWGQTLKKDIMTKTGRMLWIEHRKADVSM